MFILISNAIMFFLFLILIFILLEFVLNKLFRVQKRKISETPGKWINWWGRGIILGILILLPFVDQLHDRLDTIKWFWIFFIILAMGFQALLEWKYLKDSKQYITTLILIFFGVFIIYHLDTLFGVLLP